ncbi:PDR/VanB family oxidoreductase [Actinoplanes sp. CA-142083]|uniref:PDR/VanB family oxidoreductase n=1 Tax=Actinoplanes sp. CA-142083 TaxID=3239903 RepID=UPI003D8CB655
MRTLRPAVDASAALRLRVDAKSFVADGVQSLVLSDPGGRRLPPWTPGAHVDLVLPNGITRQFSLCGDRWDAYAYRVAVLRSSDGRGGSTYVHDGLRVGDLVGLGGPRNNFPLVPAPRYVFVAGGIGITPLLPMISQADALGADWHLFYGGRSMAFLDELSRFGDRVTVCHRGLRDLLPAVVADTDPAGARLYCCGPAPLLETVERLCAGRPAGFLRTERFVAADAGTVHDTAFEIALARSARTVTVTAGDSVLDTLRRSGVPVLSSCQQGICGTCEVPVLGGEVDHRDSLLDDRERADNTSMFVCVSRARGPRLVLDL